jgi:hypothetical protein
MLEKLREANVEYEEHEDVSCCAILVHVLTCCGGGGRGCPAVQLSTVLPKTDVLYVTRVQKERFRDEWEYNQLKQ